MMISPMRHESHVHSLSTLQILWPIANARDQSTGPTVQCSISIPPHLLPLSLHSLHKQQPKTIHNPLHYVHITFNTHSFHQQPLHHPSRSSVDGSRPTPHASGHHPWRRYSVSEL